MRPAAHLLSLATLTALLIPVLQVAATAAQKSGYFKDTRFLTIPDVASPGGIPLEITNPQHLAQANGSQSEVERLYQQGLEQFNRSQFREAIATLERVLNLVRDAGNRRGEGNVLNALGAAYRNLAQYEQAIELYEEALEIAREVNDLAEERRVLQNLAIAYGLLGQYEPAINLYEQGLAIAREIGDRAAEGRTLGNLGASYRALGNFERAIDLFEQSLAIAREIDDRAVEGRTLGNLGRIYTDINQYERSIKFLEQALVIARETGNSKEESSVLRSLGFIQQHMGQYTDAIAFYEQSLDIARGIGDRLEEAVTLQNLGVSYIGLGQLEQAIDLFEQSLATYRKISFRNGEGRVLGDLGVVYASLGKYQQAIDFHQQHLDIAREIGDRLGESRALLFLGASYHDLEQYQQALEQYRQAVALFNELGARSGESLALGNIGRLLNDQVQPELAIVFLKASVDIRESIRGDIRGLDTELQQAYTDTVASDYRFLADLLLQQDRIIEAQRVLDLLKVQELDEYLDDVQRNAQTETGVDFWQPEVDVLALYDDVLLTGTELQRLQALATLTPTEQARLAELEAQQNRLYTSFIDWLDHPQIIAAVDQLRVDTRSRTLDIDNFTDLQASLRQLPQTSVILYPLVLEERLELVLVSANAPPVRYPIDVDATTLNRTVVEFGQALKDRRSDPRPTAQQLYDWVITPLEAELAAVGAENIIFAPDGVLRYVPLAALHDGDQWLIERFTFNQITAASETDFAAAPRDSRSLLAAACADCTFSVNVGDDTFSFGDLPATRQEVETLVAQMPGAEVLIDGDFTPEQFQSLLSRYPLIHLATHGQFVSGAPEESFVLFGNGQHVNLRQMKRDWQQMDADLVVLSACETALGSAQLGDGVEVLGLGFQLQQVGAKAVLASLWQVSDQGTQVLMTEFYAALNQGLTKAEALQAAQQALIAGRQRGSETGESTIQRNAPIPTRDGVPLVGNSAYPGYSHPYYWAPFILIGNGL